MRQLGVACGLGQLHPSKLCALGPATSPFLSFISASPKGWGQPPAVAIYQEDKDTSDPRTLSLHGPCQVPWV